MSAKQIQDKYIKYFEKRNHKRIENAALVPINDPSTLFTSSGMQPLVSYLLGQQHPEGTRLVNAQNCFRAVDIDEVGDNRHTTFFRMLGNWSLGDYFKTEQIPWFFDFLIDPKEGLGLDPARLYITVFSGYGDIPKDEESIKIWESVLQNAGLSARERIFEYGVDKNWWSRSGTPDLMPPGEPGGPDTEVFYDFGDAKIHENSEYKNQKCHVNCNCGRYIEIGNSVFMQYIKKVDGTFGNLPKQNVDFGGGLERFLLAVEHKTDIFQTSLFAPIINAIEQATGKQYKENEQAMRIITDHLRSAIYIVADGVKPSNTEQGYVLRRLIRRSFDNFMQLGGLDIAPVLEAIVSACKDTDPILEEKFEEIKNTILEESEKYNKALTNAQKQIEKELKKQGKKIGDELMGEMEIPAELAFTSMTSFGLSPTQLKSLGYVFDEQKLAQKIKEHQAISKKGAEQKFRGGLADQQELTIKGHTATHLLQQALRDVLGNHVFQTGSNITVERLRFDFSHPEKLTDEQIKKAEAIVREKIEQDLAVHFEMLPLKKAKELGAIGLFDEKYQEKVKVYFIGGSGKDGDYNAYSKEFCGGPHVAHTGVIKTFKITKQEKIGVGQQRIYAVVS